jgi:hypothetical protein
MKINVRQPEECLGEGEGWQLHHNGAHSASLRQSTFIITQPRIFKRMHVYQVFNSEDVPSFCLGWQQSFRVAKEIGRYHHTWFVFQIRSLANFVRTGLKL